MDSAGVRTDDRRPACRVHLVSHRVHLTEFVSQGVHLNSKSRVAGVRIDDRRPERRSALPGRNARVVASISEKT